MIIQVFPITDGVSRNLTTVLDELAPDSKRSGKTVVWDGIGPGAETGQVYKAIRTPKRAAADRAAGREYDRRVMEDTGGNRKLYEYQQMRRLAQIVEVPEEQLPALVLWVKDPACTPAVLTIPPELLRSDEGKLVLQTLVRDELSDLRLTRLLTPAAHATARIYESLQDHANQLSDRLQTWCIENLREAPLREANLFVRKRSGGWVEFPKLGVALNDRTARVRAQNRELALSSRDVAILSYMFHASAEGQRPIKHEEIANEAGIKRLRDLQRYSAPLASLVEPVPDKRGYHRVAQPAEITETPKKAQK